MTVQYKRWLIPARRAILAEGGNPLESTNPSMPTPQPVRKSGGLPKKLRLIRNRIWRSRYIYLMILPVLAYFIIFKYTPMWFLKSAF